MRNIKNAILFFLVALICTDAKATTPDSLDIIKVKSSIPPSVLPFGKVEAVGVPLAIQGFQFDAFEDDLQNRANSIMASLNASPPESQDPTFETKFLVALGKANLSKTVKRVNEICEDAITAGRYIDKLTGGDLATMPLVKKQTFGTSDLYIIFQSAKIYPDYAEIEVYIKVDFKKENFDGTPAILYFGARDIKFSNDNGIISGAVGLLADYAIALARTDDKVSSAMWLKPMVKGAQNGGQNTTSLADDTYQYTGTYVLFDCDGFKEMGMEGAVFFSRDVMLPVNPDGTPRPNKADKDKDNIARVNGHFQIVIQDWNDMYFEVDLDHFVLTKWQKMSLHLNKATVDLSSHRNPVMPEGYSFGTNKLWEGVYIKEISITLPQPFKSNSSSYAESNPNNVSRMKVTAKDLAIGTNFPDGTPGHGVYGDFIITGQAPLIGGPIMDGKWGYSMDLIEIRFVQSNLNMFKFSGYVGVPLLSKDGPLGYTAGWERVIDPITEESEDKYTISVNDNKLGKKFPIWNVASLTIDSWDVDITIEGDDFKASVGFWGSMEVGKVSDYASSQSGSLVKIPKLTFKNLRVQTFGPYIACDGFMLDEGGSLISGFPVTIEKPTFTSLENICKIGFDITLNLMDEGSGVDASGTFALVGEYKSDANYNRYWAYKDFEFNGAQVTVSLPQFYATGTLKVFKDDPVYGNGFYASVVAKIMGTKLHLPENEGKFKLTMTALFGSTSGYKYWMVDGFLEGLRVDVFPPYFLSGFGGGAFHHMKPTAYNPSGEGKPSFAQDNSGLIYKPTRETKLGLKFSTAFAADGGLTSGLLTVIIRFGNNFSLQNITFWGTADFMIKSDKIGAIVKKLDDVMDKIPLKKEELDQKNKGELFDIEENTVKANLGLSFSFDDGFVFHGFGEVKFNVANIMTGMGTVDMLFDTKEDIWHLWVGGYDSETNPTVTRGFFDGDEGVILKPLTVKVNYGGYVVTASAYFLTGNDIPGPPPINPLVASFFADKKPKDNRDLLKCDGNSPALGTGIAFGASAVFQFKKVKLAKPRWLKCFIAYNVDISAGIGFDFSLLKYDQSAMCSTGSPIGGLNGLRATGRVFVFVDVNSGKLICLPIPKAAIGAMLDFDMPNPAYFKGILRVKFGKHSGDIGAEWGEQCGVGCNPE